jgi:uncharacterized protein YbaP (TraB family)
VKIRGSLITLLSAVAFFICASLPVSAAPALWLVQGPAGKVYLFGTVHLLRDGVQWHSPELKAAMSESQDLYLEIADLADTSAIVKATIKLGFDRDHPLSTKISKSDVALLDAAAKRYNLGSEAAFEPMQPWLVYMMFSVLPAVHAGYATGNGVDLQVRKEFVAAGKPVFGLETVETQVHVFADMSEATQIALLESALKSLDAPASATGTQAGVAQLDALVGAWSTGNQDDLSSVMKFDALSKNPMSAPLLVNRNKAWATELAARLKLPGTSFVSVGSAHMLGPDGLPALLANMGFSVTRVPITQTSPTDSPAPLSEASPAGTSSPSPMPAVSPTPIPQTLTPPAGWKKRTVTFGAGSFKTDMVWVDPNGGGVVMTGHLEMPSGLGTLDLDSLDTLFHAGIVAGANAVVSPSTRVKICSGKQDGLYTKVKLATVKEDMVMAVSDRGYLAQYARRGEVVDDPAALRSLLTLCAP